MNCCSTINEGIVTLPAFLAINTVLQRVVREVLKLIMLVCVLTDVRPTIKSLSNTETSNALALTSSLAITVNTNDSFMLTGFLSTLAVTVVKANACWLIISEKLAIIMTSCLENCLANCLVFFMKNCATTTVCLLLNDNLADDVFYIPVASYYAAIGKDHQ